jgi:hypothetical protein
MASTTTTIKQELQELRSIDVKLDLIRNQLFKERITSPQTAPSQPGSSRDVVINKISSSSPLSKDGSSIDLDMCISGRILA